MTVMTGDITFTVPEGRQAIIRSIEIIPGDVLVDTSAATGTIPDEMLLSFFVDGGAVAHNALQSIRLVEGVNRFPLFFPTPAEAKIKVLMKMNQTTFTEANTGINCAVTLQGNLVLDDARPTNFVVSTRRG